jgi:hypothetical protein
VLAPSRRRNGDLRFHGVPVYDLRQTRGRRLAALDLSVRGETRHARVLEQAAGRLGIEVVTAVLPDPALGRSCGGRIELKTCRTLRFAARAGEAQLHPRSPRA